MINSLKIGLMAGLGLLLAQQAYANPCPPGNPPTNCAPPAGAILDLDGSPVPHTYQQYSVNFTAVNTTTNLSFSFREDPAFLGLDDVSVTTGAGPNLVVNPGFELGPVGANAPTGWTYLNAFGAVAAGVVSTSRLPARAPGPTIIATARFRPMTGSLSRSQPRPAICTPSASGSTTTPT